MRVTQHVRSATTGWSVPPAGPTPAAQLVLVFGPEHNQAAWQGAWRDELRATHPDAVIVACTAGGQIAGTAVVDDGLVATAVAFAHTRVRGAAVPHAEGACSHSVGAQLAAALPAEGLRHVLVVADGVRVNGSALVRGMGSVLPAGVSISGGLAADADRFTETHVGLDADPASGTVAAVGLYGDRLVVGTGIGGGWSRFGPDRRVTRAAGNVLHALDGEPALALYRRYLGEFAEELPASALRFPLGLVTAGGEVETIRTVLGLDDAEGTMTFAGDVPEGATVRFMRASHVPLVEAAADAAADAAAPDAHVPNGDAAAGDTLALLVSCVGRRWVLGQRVEEELEAAADALAPGAALAGFYSYGELAPATAGGACALHNQTMTVTTLGEA